MGPHPTEVLYPRRSTTRICLTRSTTWICVGTQTVASYTSVLPHKAKYRKGMRCRVQHRKLVPCIAGRLLHAQLPSHGTYFLPYRVSPYTKRIPHDSSFGNHCLLIRLRQAKARLIPTPTINPQRDVVPGLTTQVGPVDGAASYAKFPLRGTY